MKIPLIVISVCWMLSLGTVNAPLPDDSVTLYGSYLWRADPRDPGELRAVFTPTGRGLWKVAFHFRFSGRKHAYRGTAEGSLGNGRLSGKVRDERGRRTFFFEGNSRDGHFSGTHSEEKRAGSAEATGTLELSRKR